MHRFFIPAAEFFVEQGIELPEEVLRHLRTVLRLPAGTECELLNGDGQIAHAQISENYKARILSVSQAPTPLCHLSLIQGLPKGEKLELVLQKGTELGVSRFLPTQMTRSVGRLKPGREEKKHKRWEKVVQEAARQSGQAFLPQVQIEHSLSSALTAVDADLKLLLWEDSDQPLAQLLPVTPPPRVAVIVGPEGGITEDEVQIAGLAGYQPISLGPRILRTETAGLAIMAILQYLYGDLANGRCSRNVAFQGKDES